MWPPKTYLGRVARHSKETMIVRLSSSRLFACLVVPKQLGPFEPLFLPVDCWRVSLGVRLEKELMY